MAGINAYDIIEYGKLNLPNLQEISMAPMYLQEQHNIAEEQLNATLSETEKAQMAAMQDPNSNAARIYQDYTNRLKQATFYGAYIGAGFNVNTGQIKLVGSSNIYTYKVDTKEFLLADNFKEIEKSYENAKNTANQIKSFLPSILNASEVKKAGYCLDPNFESLNEVPEHKIQSDECYASVHGLVKAAIYFNNNKDFVPIEHALSKDTIKVASCIPCSIFASAINRPVNYTHLGRGDSWNFPLAHSSLFEKDVIDDKRKMFYKYVKSCFLKGLEFVPHLVKEKLDLVTLDNIKTKQEEVVGNIFLYSLTFEGSFTERMLKFLI